VRIFVPAAAAAVVTAVSLYPRVAVMFDALPPALKLFAWTDIFAMWRDSGLAGHKLPYADVDFAYPPVIGYVSGLLSLVTDNAAPFVAAWAAIVIVAAAIGGAIFARAAGPRRAMLFWACTPQLLLTAGINFDVIAAVIAGAAAIRSRGGQDLRSLGLLAVGTATKFYPAAFAPILVLRRFLRGDRRGAIVGSLVFVATLALLYLPAIVAARSTAKFVATYAVSKPANFDSFWEIPSVVLQAAGVDASLIVLGATAVGLLITYAALVLPRALRAADPVVGFALAVSAVLFWTRFYSPQYAIWLLPFFVLLPLRGRTFALISIADVGVFIGISLLTLVLRPDDALVPFALLMLVASVVLRQIMLVVLWREVARLGDRPRERSEDRPLPVASA
jgi:uncharacterized membrane protein